MAAHNVAPLQAHKPTVTPQPDGVDYANADPAMPIGQDEPADDLAPGRAILVWPIVSAGAICACYWIVRGLGAIAVWMAT